MPPGLRVVGAICLGVKQPGHEADQSPPSSVNFNNVWANTFIPPYVFKGPTLFCLTYFPLFIVHQPHSPTGTKLQYNITGLLKIAYLEQITL